MSLGTVSGTFSATGQSAAYTARGPFSVSIYGTFSATVVLEYSLDGGSNWETADLDTSGTDASFTAAIRFVVDDPEIGVLYRLDCTAYTSGTVSYRISD